MSAARKRGARLGTRSLIALSLVLFVFVAAIVVWRRSIGVANAREIARLDTRRRELESELSTMQRNIDRAMGNRRIVADAERQLGMHVATELEVRTFTRDGLDANGVHDARAAAAARPADSAARR